MGRGGKSIKGKVGAGSSALHLRGPLGAIQRIVTGGEKFTGGVRWTNDSSKLHREDGPAIVYDDGREGYYINGKLHREDGPARELADGSRFYYRDGLLHREDGPAAFHADGTREWYKNGEPHREGAPARTYPDGREDWLIDGLYREDGPAIIYPDGTEAWVAKEEIPYEFEGEIAEKRIKKEDYLQGYPVKNGKTVNSNGEEIWYHEGQVHRADGPALSSKRGGEVWCNHGVLHRTDGGPAIILPDGTQEWLVDGKLHREDGPARILRDGSQEFHENGVLLKRELSNGTEKWYTDGEGSVDYKDSRAALRLDADPMQLAASGGYKDERNPVWIPADAERDKRLEKAQKLHRLDGPAVTRDKEVLEYAARHYGSVDPLEEWHKDDKLHRADGPAVTRLDGTREWWVDGEIQKAVYPDGTKSKYKEHVETDEGTERLRVVSFSDGREEHRLGNRKNGRHLLHREDGPALSTKDGRREWHNKGKLHREDGPAIEYADGGKEWWVDDKLHKTEGPAVVHADGRREWWVDGKLHREDGPAIVRADGRQEFFVEGILKRVIFADGKEQWYAENPTLLHQALFQQKNARDEREEDLNKTVRRA